MSLMRNPWVRLSLDVVNLAVESQSVVALRMMKFARGGAAAADEATLMVTEKIGAAVTASLQLSAFDAGPDAARRTTALLRRKVRANRRRLSRAG